jgi:hypothetical protein
MLAPSGRGRGGLPLARQQQRMERGEKVAQQQKGKEAGFERAVNDAKEAAGKEGIEEGRGVQSEAKKAKVDGEEKVPPKDAEQKQGAGVKSESAPGKGKLDVNGTQDGSKVGDLKVAVPSPGPIHTIDLSPTRLLPLGAPSLADLAWSTIAGGTTAAALGEQVPEHSGPFGRTKPKPVKNQLTIPKPESSSEQAPKADPEKRKPGEGPKDSDSKSDGTGNRGGGGIRTVVASSARPLRSPIVDLNLTIAGGPPPSPVGELARPVFGPGAILRAPIFGSLAQEADQPAQAASFESRGPQGGAAASAMNTPDSRQGFAQGFSQGLAQGFSQGVSHDAKMSHFSPQLAGGSTVTTPHTRTLKRKPADSAEGMVLENDGGDDEMEVEGGGRPAIPAHLLVRGSSRFSRPVDREARPQETAGVESVNVDMGGSVEARGAPDVRGGREASVSGMAGDRAGKTGPELL